MKGRFSLNLMNVGIPTSRTRYLPQNPKDSVTIPEDYLRTNSQWLVLIQLNRF